MPPPYPPGSSEVTEITFAATVSGTVDSFDQTAQTNYINGLATTLGVNAADITLSISAASVNVVATIRTNITSVASAATSRLSSITAADEGGDPGLDGGDTLTIVFNKETNQPSVSDTSAIDAVVAFSTSVGSAYSGSWSSHTQFVVTVTSAATGGAALTGTKVRTHSFSFPLSALF